MANFIGAIEAYNPYIQQIPTEAYTKVGMFKEQQYEAGVQKVQESVDHIAGLDIANEGGRQYLRARVGELTKSLNKYSTVDFSNPNNVSQLVGLAKPLYQDENIVNDVINTGVYRKWAKDSNEAFKAGKMELGQYVRESADASQWLNSKAAGADYTGRSTPNLATKKDLVDRIVKIKKDGLEKNEFVYEPKYDKDKPYWVKSTDKHYSEAEFNNFITDSIMSDKDKEMLSNEHWYENQGIPIEALQKQDIMMYQSKIDQNNKQIEYYKSFGDTDKDGNVWANDKKMEHQQVINDLTNYNKQLSDGKIKYLQELNLADPNSRDVFHRDLSEARFVNSLAILRDQVQKNELTKNEQWFEDKKLEIELAKESLRISGKNENTGIDKSKTPAQEINETSFIAPVPGNGPKTEVSLNTLQNAWHGFNEDINGSMNSLIGSLQKNGVDMSQFLAKNADGSFAYDQVQIGSKGGASSHIPRFKDQESKDKFYNMAAGLDFYYTMEGQDGHIDKKGFGDWIKNNLGMNDNDPNSKFTLQDKMVSDALNTLKGTSALMPKLEGLFSDKSVVRTLAGLDKAIGEKKKFANDYREALLKSGALTGAEMNTIKNVSDENLLSPTILDKAKEENKFGTNKIVTYRIKQEKDKTYSLYQRVFNKTDEDSISGSLDKEPLSDNSSSRDSEELKLSPKEVKLSGGFSDWYKANDAFNKEGALNNRTGISNSSLEKANDFVKQTYSYVQENLVTTAQNLKNNKPMADSFNDALNLFVNSAKTQTTNEDISVENGTVDLRKLQGIGKMDFNGFSVENTADVFNPNPTVKVTFTAVDPNSKTQTPREYNATVSLRSFLATNPNYRTQKYAEYFAPLLYAKEDASARIHSKINPLQGSEASYANRGDIEPVFSRKNQQGKQEFVGDDPQSHIGINDPSGQIPAKSNTYGNQYQWEMIPVEKDGKQTMISYQVVSLGEDPLGNIKNKDGNTYAPGAYYIKMKIPTPNGQPKVIFIKTPDGTSRPFQSASYAHYFLKDLLLNNPNLKMDDIDQKTNQPNYFTTDPTSLRGILNAQLLYNGYPKIESEKLKAAISEQERIKIQEETLRQQNIRLN